MENVSVNSTIIKLHVLSTTNVIVGTTYIVNAVIFILLHILCSYFMCTDKEMKNPTYAFMINLSIADCIQLSMEGIYASVIILTKYENEMLARIASFLCILAWFANSILFVLIAFSRWIALTRPHLTKTLFSKKKLWSLQGTSWLLASGFCFYGNILYPPGPVFPFIPDMYSWAYDQNSELGRTMAKWGELLLDTICTVTETSFNILSLIWVHETRKSIQSVVASKNKKREIKLLVQCVISGCAFMACYIMFVVVYALQLDSLTTCLSVQAVWTFYHCVNPLVYLSVNTKLRNQVLKCLACR